MYTEKQLKMGNTLVTLTWLFAIACFFFPLYGMGIGALGRALFWLLAIVHLIEFVFFFRFYKDIGEPLLGHFVRHMAFGILHQAAVKQRVAGAQASEG